MGLSFFYEFTAPATTPASELEAFLHDVQQLAQSLGFDPTIVLNVPFDTPERREFANRLGGNFTLQDARLRGVAIPAPGQLRNHDPESGECRLFPERAVVLVVTDERGYETCFGFFQFPEHIVDIHGANLADTGLEGRWWFRDFVDSPDPRYRALVTKFSKRGFVQTATDEFAPQ
jgi:hypothetical protein